MGIFYRYENVRDGFGPYRGDMNYINQMLLAHGKDTGQPSPMRDEGIERYPRHYEVYACLSVEALLDWFSGFNKTLFDEGFEIVEYECDFTTIGTRQVLLGSNRVVTNVFESVTDAIQRAAIKTILE